MGMKTQRVKGNGLTHQVRRVLYGLADGCKTCKGQGGHLAVYQDGGPVDGSDNGGMWVSNYRSPIPTTLVQPANMKAASTPRLGMIKSIARLGAG